MKQFARQGIGVTGAKKKFVARVALTTRKTVAPM